MDITKRNLTFAVLLTALGIIWVNSSIFAQVSSVQNVQEQIKEMKLEIPFVDKDGDGINDLLQSGWGLKFVKQYRNRKAVWDQMVAGEEHSKQQIDTDGDGVPDTPLRDFMRQRMHELVDTNGDGISDTPFGKYMKDLMKQLIDTNGDGVADTPLAEYMRKNFQLFDQNGDGIPDKLTPEQIRANFEEMREWRETIKNNLLNGLPAFTDEDGDGIPDNLPEGFMKWMKRYKKKGGGGM